MRKWILTALLAATVAPIAVAPASAQSRAEVRDSYRDLQHEKRQLDRAYREGDRRDIRREQRDVREARQEYRGDLRDYRRSHPRVYSRGAWRAPFPYRQWNRGARLNRSYYAPRYYINNPRYYRLPAPGRNMRWVRHYDDVLLVNIRTGAIVDVHRGFFF